MNIDFLKKSLFSHRLILMLKIMEEVIAYLPQTYLKTEWIIYSKLDYSTWA